MPVDCLYMEPISESAPQENISTLIYKNFHACKNKIPLSLLSHKIAELSFKTPRTPQKFHLQRPQNLAKKSEIKGLAFIFYCGFFLPLSAVPQVFPRCSENFLREKRNVRAVSTQKKIMQEVPRCW